VSHEPVVYSEKPTDAGYTRKIISEAPPQYAD